jgi:phosphoglycolate phosphatase
LIPYAKIRTIFFDYDGTLHNSIHLYAPAFRKAYDFLVQEGIAVSRSWTDKEISYWLGFNPQDMWKDFMPDLSEELRQKCSTIIGEEMMLLIQHGEPHLYTGALELLRYLKTKGYHLVFISNCKTYYKECHTRLFGLDQYFDTLVCSDEFNFIPKHEILNKIMNQFPKEMVIIGDRKQDIDAGKENNIYTMGCSYGFALPGELKEADLIIHDIHELFQYF